MAEDYLLVDNNDDFVELSFPTQPSNSKVVNHYDPAIGRFDNLTYSLPFMHVNDIEINVLQDTVIKIDQPGSLVTFSFHLSEGNLDVTYTGSGKRYTMENTGHTMIHDLGNLFGKVGNDAPVRILGILMSADYFSQLINGNDKWSDQIVSDIQNKRSFVHTAMAPVITAAMKQTIGGIQQMLRSGRPDRLQMQSAVFRLLSQHLENIRPQKVITPADSQLRKEDIDKLYRLRQYIDVHFLEHNTLSDYAQISTLNEFKLKKGFRQLFNSSLFQYVNSLRMEYANVMLCDEQKTAKEMAAILGYRYVHHFVAAYRKHFGIRSGKRTDRS